MNMNMNISATFSGSSRSKSVLQSFFLLAVLFILFASTASSSSTCTQRHSSALNRQRFVSMLAKPVPIRSAEWAKQRGMEPGYGGIWPGDPNAKKYSVKIKSKKNPSEVFSLMVPVDRYIYFYFEEQGIELPVINSQKMCRQGCCTICTGKVMNEGGKVKMDTPLGLLKDFREKVHSILQYFANDFRVI